MPKYLFITIFLFFTQNSLLGQVFDVQTLMNNGSSDNRINFVYMGDGYTASQQDLFISNAQSAANAQFDFTPYKEYKNFFNAYAIKVISNEEGVDHPGTATDVAEPVFPVGTADTYFDSTFDYYNIHRLLVPVNNTAIYDVLSENIPYYDQANIIVNTPYYGGSGGSFATASTNSQSNLIMIHEIGHSFVSLADEYWAGASYAAEKANMTQESDPALVKWKNWIGDETIDIYAYGTSSPKSDWFRPHQSCMMRQLNGQFCAVCREATIDKIYNLVTPIDTYYPEEATVLFDGSDLDFSVDLVFPEPNTLTIEWFLDTVSFNTSDQTITLTGSELGTEAHVLTVNIEDVTDLSRTYTFANGYLFSVTWNINNTLSIEENTIQKFLYKIYPNPSQRFLNFNYNASDIQEEFSLIISDVQGKIIQTKKFIPENGSHQFTIDIKNLQSGFYVLNVKASTYNRSFKFIKE